MDITRLPDKETHVLRSLALLGDATVDREAFDAWLGGRHGGALDALAEKGLVQVSVCGQKEKLSVQKDIGDMALDLLKPGLHCCGWAEALCKKLAEETAGHSWSSQQSPVAYRQSALKRLRR